MSNKQKPSKQKPSDNNDLPSKLPDNWKDMKMVKIDFNLKKILTWGLAIILIIWTISSFFSYVGEKMTIPFSQALSDIKAEKIERIKVSDDKLTLFYKQEDKVAVTNKEPQEGLVTILQQEGISPSQVEIEVADEGISQVWVDILLTLVPLVLTAAFFYVMFKKARGAQNSIFSFGKSGAQPFFKGKQSTNFSDVAGVEEAKKELKEVVDFLKNPEKYRRLGARTPKGVLLVGPPGTGKTLLARAVAGEAQVPFYSMAGSEFMEMLVGVGSARMRDLFETAKKHAPTIIFIDEIESIGRSRSRGMGGGHDEREQTLNQMLVEMDGFTPNDNVVVIGATNRPDLLDSALLRPGRFDRRIVLPMPDITGRKAILKIHAQGKPFVDDVDWRRVAKRTVGFSGADLENMLNEAAILAAREDKEAIDMDDLEEAATKVKLGPQRERLQSEEERKMAAYHEAGHALVAHFSPRIDPIGRVSIVARGLTLGHTMISPTRDRNQETKSRLLEQVSVILGGRAAEEIAFSEETTGAEDDINKATKIARKMVAELGMSSLGPISFENKPSADDYRTGRKFAQMWSERDNISPDTLSRVDKEVKKVIMQRYESAKEILTEQREILDKLAEKLIQEETVDRSEFETLVGDKPD